MNKNFRTRTHSEQCRGLNHSLSIIVALFVLELSGCQEQRDPFELEYYRILGPVQADLGLGNAQKLSIIRGYFHELNDDAEIKNFNLPLERIPQVVELINSGTHIELFIDAQQFSILKIENASGETELIQVFRVDDNAVIKFDGQYYLIGKMAPLYNLLLDAVRSSQSAK